MAKQKLVVAYIDGWDRRLLDEDRAPFMHAQFERQPWAETTGPANVDLLPTILTGTRPDQHGMFGVRLRPPRHRTPVEHAVDFLPDRLTTSIQCGLFAVSGLFDLPAVPPRRRRRYEIHRSKLLRNKLGLSVLLEVGDQPTCFGVVGADRSRYIYSTSSDPSASHLDDLGTGDFDLEFLQLYTMDLVMRWNYGHHRIVKKYSNRVDDFVRRLSAKCRDAGVTLMLLSDHGYDMTQGSVDVMRAVRRLGLSRKEYTEFVEVSSARFWFHSDRARHQITDALGGLENLTVHEWADFRSWGVELRGPEYGELFCLTKPGWVLFPNDFHHPLGNWALGLIDPKQRRRLASAKHRGSHAIRPDHPAARGFIMVCDDRYRALRSNARLEDVAPSILAILERPRPDTMLGTPIFES